MKARIDGITTYNEGETKTLPGFDFGIYDEGEVEKLYQKVTRTLMEKGKTVSTMESCTSGLVASFITDTEGASEVLKGAYVTYSNEAKVMQGVPEEVILEYGVYSKETAYAMANACRESYQADIGIGVTGSLDRTDPNNEDSIAGKVYVCVAFKYVAIVTEISLPKSLSRHEAKVAVAQMLVPSILGFL